MGGNRHLYEFVVPMVPPVWNERETVAGYRTADGVEPATAVAYSLLDVVQPAMEEGEDYYEHWILTHFLLDGHHKMEAAAAVGRPVRLLSLVDESSSLASREDLTALVRARSQAMRTRR
jgi:hypothetical protein